jgi:hypothetical protein
MLRELEEGDVHIVVYVTTTGGSGANEIKPDRTIEIYVNPYEKPHLDGTPTYPESTIVHELVHAYREWVGSSTYSPTIHDREGPERRIEEVTTTYLENVHRAAMRVELRSKYGDWPIPDEF